MSELGIKVGDGLVQKKCPGLPNQCTSQSYALFLPSFGATVFSPELMAQGPWGVDWLRPQAFFGIEGMDPVVHALVWSMALNAALFFGVSLVTFPTPLERLQGAQFVNVFEHSPATRRWTRTFSGCHQRSVTGSFPPGA